MYKLVFTRSEIKTQKIEKDPLTGENVLVDIKSIHYDELPKTELNIGIKSIRPQIEEGILKSLEFEITKFGRIDETPEQIAEQTQSIQTIANNNEFFIKKLAPIQENIIRKLVEKINELNDPKIYFEDHHRAHFAIKYNKGRAKAWMVIKQSGSNLNLWIRINEDNYQDTKILSRLYKDKSKTHGNRIIKLTAENIEDVMNLVHQSYEFRKRDDYFELYSKIV